MKAYKHLGTTALPLLGLLVANSMPTTTARSDTIIVDSSGTTFSVKRYDDGRNEPYTVTFTEDSVQSTYTFNTAGFVTDIIVGSETYEVLYESNGDLTEVNLTSYRRKRSLQAKPGDELPSAGRTNLPVDLASVEQAGDEKLVVGDGGGADGALKSSYHPRLLTIACDDCIEAWDAVCDEGVPSVCELVDYGAPISSSAEASIDIMCEVMRSACSSSGGEETCDGQCEGSVDDDDDDDDGDDDDDDDDDDKVLNSCLDSTSDDYKCSFDGTTTTINLTPCAFTDDDAEDIPACFEAFGKENIERLWLSFHEGLTTLPVNLLSGLNWLVDMDLSYNGLVTLPAGVFSSLTEVIKLEIHNSHLVSLPEGVFSGMTKLEHLVVSASDLTSLPAEIFSPLVNMEILDLGLNFALQCVPSSTATTVNVASDDVFEGTCECEPVEAITCETGTSCRPGAYGYTCE